MLSKIAENFGADGLLIINPYYNKGNKSGIKAHFTKIAQSVDTPIIIYNVPSRTGVNLSPNLIAELSYNCLLYTSFKFMRTTIPVIEIPH